MVPTTGVGSALDNRQPNSNQPTADAANGAGPKGLGQIIADKAMTQSHGQIPVETFVLFRHIIVVMGPVRFVFSATMYGLKKRCDAMLSLYTLYALKLRGY